MTEPIITVICGTYNRLETLQRMVNSVRNTVPDSIPVQFIIADNASSDGTWAWLQSQEDIHALQMGAPVGAIKAFTEAGKCATSPYTLIATDDIYFPAGAIIKALGHLDSVNSCGAVTFKHNKRRNEFLADMINVTLADGTKQTRPYAQIALVRTDLANECGWWGADHPIMGNGFTYGGDNFLSAGIWERGYSIDTVNGAHNIEDVFEDESRHLSREKHKRDSQLYFECYPTITIPSGVDIPDTEHLRILLLVHYSPTHPEHKKQKLLFKRGFQHYGIVIDYDYAGSHHHGQNVNQQLARICEDFKPHVIFSQVHNPSDAFSVATARTLRSYAPSAFMINWNGDVWEKNINRQDTQDLLSYYDLCLFSNAQLARVLAKRGYNTGYLPCGIEPLEVGLDTTQPAHDIIFAGNGYSDERVEMMQSLRALPYDVGLYGRAKGVEMDGVTHYNWAVTRGLYHNAKVAICDQQFLEAQGYVSNRMWEVMASGGAIALQQAGKALEGVTDLVEGVHFRSYDTQEEMHELIDYYMTHDDERKQIACNAYRHVWSHHSPSHRVGDILKYVEAFT